MTWLHKVRQKVCQDCTLLLPQVKGPIGWNLVESSLGAQLTALGIGNALLVVGKDQSSNQTQTNLIPMRLTQYAPCSSPARVTDFDQWLRHPFAGYPSMANFFELGNFFGNTAAPQLATDVYEDADNFYARFEVPGVKKEEVKIELHNGLLGVSVEKSETSPGGQKTQRISRSLSVPDSVDSEKVAAKLENGILTVTLPKQPDRKPRSITIG